MSTIGTILLFVGAIGGLCVLVLPIWALRRHNRMYPEGRDRISRDPESAQRIRRFETMWTYFSGRGGGGF